jgi:hypothetical protein
MPSRTCLPNQRSVPQVLDRADDDLVLAHALLLGGAGSADEGERGESCQEQTLHGVVSL